MSIAWSTLVFIVVLLPGVFFFVGVYIPEEFTRETEHPSALGQLAGVVLVSLLVHGFLYAVLTPSCGNRLPCIRLDGLLDIASGDVNRSGGPARASLMVRVYHVWILGYFLSSGALGGLLGFLYGLVASGVGAKWLSRHPWVHELRNDRGITLAYVVTHLKHDQRYVMYKGLLRNFGLQKDGRFSYIVLVEVARMYLLLSDEHPETSPATSHRAIGRSSPDGEIVHPTESVSMGKRGASMLFIEGEDVANVVFDKVGAPRKLFSQEAFAELVLKLELELPPIEDTPENSESDDDLPRDSGN